MGIKTIIIVIAALAVIGGGAYYVTNNKNDDQKQSESSQSAEQNNGEQNSINSLLAQKKNVTCTFSSTDGSGNQTSGTVYIAGERMRGNFNYQASGEAEQKSNVLRDNEYQYFWQEGVETGFKMGISEMESSDDSKKDNNQSQAVDQNIKYDFDCSDWSVDESMFNVPDNVKFTDYSNQIEQTKQLQKDACKGITNKATRDACEKAIQ